MKCPKCNSDIQAGDKFCRECGERLPSVCPQCGREISFKDKFCPECGTKLTDSITPTRMTVSIPKLEDMHSQLQSLIPDALAQKYLSAEQQYTGENRPITALFADISGFTPLSATKSSETIFQLVQDSFKQLVNIVAKYEGSISGFRGDGLLALFGAPILHENDAERAILSAIDMRETMKDHQLQVSIGINTAMMTVGEIQTQLHNEYTAYGTDINLAKRLQESAEAGQILVGSGTHRLTRRAFDFDIISDLTIKGFTQPVTAYSVQNVKTHPEKLRGIEGLRARMIGREHEFAEVKESVDEWLNGHGQMVSIIGEAGMGKSRLVSELKSYLTGKENKPFQYIEGRCVSIGQPISYWPFIDIIRTYFNLSEGDDAAIIASKVTDSIYQLMPQSADETLPLLGQLLSIKYGSELDDRLKFATPEQVRHQTLMRLRDIFTTLARQKPLLLILEDLHWSDDLSVDLISLLMDELANTPLMLLCVYRPEHDHRIWQMGNQARRKCMDRYIEIMLKPLSNIESRELIESLLEIDKLPETIKKMIMEKSEGNPFFIEEVIRSLIERGMIYQENDRWIAKDEISNIDVPDTIQSVILSRVDRLQAEAKYVLQCASVIGRLFKHRLLDHLTQHERELNKYMTDFEERELVYRERMIPELEYAFKHALIQEATYQSILERKRREFHLQIAQGIEGLYQERLEEYYEELADHYSKSDNIEKAVEYLLKAGKKAKIGYANESAISYYQQALDMLRRHDLKRDDWRLDALYELWEIYRLIGNFAAESLAKEAIKLAKDMKLPPRQLARIYSQLASALMIQGRGNEGIRYAEIGLDILGDDTRCMEAAMMYSIIGVGYRLQGNSDKYWDYVQKYIPFIRELPYSKDLGFCYLHIIENSVTRIGLDSAWRWSEELEKYAERNHDLWVLSWVYLEKAYILWSKGDYMNAFLFEQKVFDMVRRIGATDEVCSVYWKIIDILIVLGMIEEAKPYAQVLMGMIDRAEFPNRIVGIYLSMGDFEMTQRHWEQAILYYQNSVAKSQSSENSSNVPYSLIPLGRALLRNGDYELSINSFQEAINVALNAPDYTCHGKAYELMPFLVQPLEEMEKAYIALGTPGKFITFCQHLREQYKKDKKSLSMGQLFLEPAQPSENYSYSIFTDDFELASFDPSWNWLDEFKDCVYMMAEACGLEIHAANGRNLYQKNMSAPRLIRETSGDFAVEVFIKPASEDKPQQGGLLIWKDKDSFIRFERGIDGEHEMRLQGNVNGEWQIAGRGMLIADEDQEVHLRLERLGDEFISYCSIDGKYWFTCGKMTLPMKDPIQVGIHAIGMIDRTIYCGEYKEGTATLFRNFRIWTK